MKRIVYQAIKNRFIMQFMPVAEYEETRIETKIIELNLKGLFISKGKVQLVEGWKKVEKIQSKDTILPLVQVNEHVDLIKHEIDLPCDKAAKASHGKNITESYGNMRKKLYRR